MTTLVSRTAATEAAGRSGQRHEDEDVGAEGRETGRHRREADGGS